MTEAGDRLAGSVRWAVVPSTPRPPSRIYAGPERAPFEVTAADRIVEAARRLPHAGAASERLRSTRRAGTTASSAPPGQRAVRAYTDRYAKAAQSKASSGAASNEPENTTEGSYLSSLYL